MGITSEEALAAAIAFHKSHNVANYNNMTNKPTINNVELNGNKTSEQLGLLSVDSIGKGISLGFDGTLASNVLTFENPLGEPYDIKENYEYEIDLHFAVAGDIDDSVEVEIENDGEMIQFWSINHTDVTSSITVGELKSLSYYSNAVGYRWLFKAVCRITSSGVKAFMIYPTVNKTLSIEDMIV